MHDGNQILKATAAQSGEPLDWINRSYTDRMLSLLAILSLRIGTQSFGVIDLLYRCHRFGGRVEDSFEVGTYDEIDSEELETESIQASRELLVERELDVSNVEYAREQLRCQAFLELAVRNGHVEEGVNGSFHVLVNDDALFADYRKDKWTDFRMLFWEVVQLLGVKAFEGFTLLDVCGGMGYPFRLETAAFSPAFNRFAEWAKSRDLLEQVNAGAIRSRSFSGRGIHGLRVYRFKLTVLEKLGLLSSAHTRTAVIKKRARHVSQTIDPTADLAQALRHIADFLGDRLAFGFTADDIVGPDLPFLNQQDARSFIAVASVSGYLRQVNGCWYFRPALVEKYAPKPVVKQIVVPPQIRVEDDSDIDVDLDWINDDETRISELKERVDELESKLAKLHRAAQAFAALGKALKQLRSRSR